MVQVYRHAKNGRPADRSETYDLSMAIPQPTSASKAPGVTIAPLQESDLDAVDRIFRLAFSTFLGLPDPVAFHPGSDIVRTRWLADPSGALGAKLNGELIGSNFVTNWGSVGFFGPLSVRPDYWDKGIGQCLIEATMDLFTRWGTRHAGLFTFAQSSKHIALYQKFGFWPRYLTADMSRPVGKTSGSPRCPCYSEMNENEREESLQACRRLTGAIFDGLDVSREILALEMQKLGDTVLLWDEAGLAAFAVCQCGEGTEAGPGVCYIKFGAVRPGPGAPKIFDRMFEAAEGLAARRSLSRLVAGVNLGRHAAYRRMLATGFRLDLQGVVMQRPNERGYNRPEVYVVDDWR